MPGTSTTEAEKHRRTLEEAGEKWLEARATGRDTTRIDREVAEATAKLEELERSYT